MTVRVATDVGGTFTDLVYIDEGKVKAVKSDTTPPNFEQGVVNAVDKASICLDDVDFFAHGSTVVINAITERKGVKTGLITTQGFRDILEIARGNTPDIFNNCYQKPSPFVERHLRLELPERLDHQGNVVTKLDLTSLPEIISYFKSQDIEAIGVCFLHAYLNPIHEQETVAAIKQGWPEVDVISSHEISAEWREYERTNTTVLSAYVLPPTQQYLNKLKTKLAEKGLKNDPFIMQSNGGIATLNAASKNPITLVESGPVGGILGAAAYGKVIGDGNIMALDIGGTTAKCSLIHNGETRITTEYMLEKTAKSAGYPVKTPVIDIVEIGNGGGSVAWIDAAGSLHVGPQSAGSTPGPVAYGRGGNEPTTTDANLYTGRINPENFAGGDIKPDVKAVHNAFAKLGGELGVQAMDVAHGVLKIANSNMVNALKLISVNRGYDPRDFSLMAFGGGGALHATALAKELNAKKVIIPPFAGVFSAWGMLMIDLRRDYIQTHKIAISRHSKAEIDHAFDGVINKALADYQEDGFSDDRVMHELYLDARYDGQEHTVKIAVPDLKMAQEDFINELITRFHKAHEQEYTFSLEGSAIEVVNLHLVAYGLLDKAEIASVAKSESIDASSAKVGERDVDFDDLGVHNTCIYQRELLHHGMEFTGPAIIEEPTTTTVVLPDSKVEVDAFGGIHIHLNQ
ncbi:5-oxoprolinase [Pseudoalteromonas sp. GCY]|uniref:hydantoinase/oxoprolinase family protein n=1 Tax=Pseudoalteromonas sp. GCY TaxID=2003316 RepID=UPI000BFEC064|nr:hydantoinase/oxoprolinase family protein [Pseudoalteromonas sp. GCY]PHI35707.1 5-oxoprolinase [Pseudoalteromonas sp. GCY]QQQ67990.1 hydantoinase/oxoprolinase family protein [Pseudoalteromonas sp. GCY]